MVRKLKLLRWGSGAGVLAVLVLLYLIIYSLILKHRDPEVTDIYFADRITPAHRILIDRFNQAHAGRIRVIPIDFPNKDFSTNERKEILARSLRGEGDGIDLLAVDVIWAQRFAKWCEPLGKYFRKEELSRILPEALYSCYTDSQLVAVPLYLVTGVMYYREDLLTRLPGGIQAIEQVRKSITWTDFVKLKSTLHYQGPFYVFPAADYEGLVCTYIELLLSLEPDYFSKMGFRFATPQGREALQLMVDLIQKYKATPEDATRFTEVPSYEYFIKNDGLFIHGWNSFDKDFKDAPYNVEKESHLKMVPVPHFASGRPASLFGGWNLMVTKFSKKKDAVMEFVKFLLRDDSQEVFYTDGAFYPIVTSFYENPEQLQRHPEITSIRELLRTGVHRPMQKDYTKYSKIMSHYFVLAMRNEATVDGALRSVDQAIQSERLLDTSQVAQ